MTARREIEAVTERIRERSRPTREAYLARIDAAAGSVANRAVLSCGNLAHGFAACAPADKAILSGNRVPNIGIITSYNDMLSAHQPFEPFPRLIKEAAREAGGVAQVAGGVPAMCDGVTQGQPGMELSLFSRDVIAMAAAIGLSHNMFDAAVYLGVCDKIVPGLVVAALTFGHLPAIFIPAGPMTSGLPNDEKAKIRQLYAEGKVGRDALLESESKSYHGPGTCTFYGTANSNQMLMEMMGLHTPGSSFVNPNTPLRDALTKEAAKRALAITALGNEYTPVGRMIDERSIVNGIIGLNATGGSTNHTIHLIAMAAAAGIRITWTDIAEISDAVPLLARVYPNGLADVNHFHAAGGLGFLIRELLDAGYLHEDVHTVWGEGLRSYAIEAKLAPDGTVLREPAPTKSGDEKVLVPADKAFQPTGGICLLTGNLGNAIIKISAVKPEHRLIEAPAIVFREQEELQAAFKAGELDRDFVAV
ncbi:MAG TPA: phosphogluconate dehydratase, partial [Rhizobiaceae bacterium]|nr:phosphogluconate dehydratase [Rhizobiaceae bacterium]